jgi:glycosyltransferase involved in cell wall biosynthesis
MKTPVLMHASVTREDHGGIQSVLAYHLRQDGGLGFRPRFLSCFDRESRWPGDCQTLAGHGWERIGTLRRRFAAAVASDPPDVIVYHDGWGLPWFAPLDRAGRRIVFMHAEPPQFDELVRRFAPRVDGFMAVSYAMADRIRALLPDFPAERIQGMHYFIDPPAEVAAGIRREAPGPVRFGYAGRIVRAQKRMERLPVLLAELDRRGVDYVFELMGDGPYEPGLRRALAGHPRVRWLGWRQGSDYWRTLASWRGLVLLTDFEGLSRVSLEALACGTVPVFPDYSPAAREVVGPLAQHGLYPVGDVAAAADRIAALAALEPPAVAALAELAREHVRSRRPDVYFDGFGKFTRRIMALPPHARVVPPPAWQDWVLLGVYTRLFPRHF